MPCYAAVAVVLRHDPSVGGLAGGFAHRQRHHYCVVELHCFLSFEDVSMVLVPQEQSAARRSLRNLLRSHNCVYALKKKASNLS